MNQMLNEAADEVVGGMIAYKDESWHCVAGGCTECSSGCKNCWVPLYRARMCGMGITTESERLAWQGSTGAVAIERMFDKLKTWTMKPRVIVVYFLGDLFHKCVSDALIIRVFKAMQDMPMHTFLVLSRRTSRMERFLLTHPELRASHIIIGASIEEQRYVDERMPNLLRIAELGYETWVSCEPLLGPLDFSNIPMIDVDGTQYHADALTGEQWYGESRRPGMKDATDIKLSWVVTGSETVPKGSKMVARRPNIAWFRQLRDACATSDTPFFLQHINPEKDCRLDGVMHRDMRGIRPEGWWATGNRK